MSNFNKSTKIIPIISALGVTLMMSACASGYDVDKTAGMTTSGDAFTSALHKRYMERARFEVGEHNWESVRFFNRRAMTAAGGTAPALQSPMDRQLKKDTDAIGAGYTRLANALAAGAAKSTPDACALSQTWLEHWMEQSEEGHQPDHIQAARKGFEAAIPDCAPGMKTSAFIVYFDFNSDTLNPAAYAVLSDVAEAVKSNGNKTVTLSGHTDRAGADAYNDALSDRRVMTVKGVLSAMGIKADIKASSFGEKQPSVATDDGVRNAKNRRVEITLN